MAGAAIALVVAACEPEPPVSAANPATALVSTSPAPKADTKTELGALIESSPKSGVAGERLNVELLHRFYARHGYAPVWTTRQEQENSLINAVSRAGDHGLDPELFHASALKSPATSAALDRELLLSDAFLTYADALARGVMPVERRSDDQVLKPEPIDVAAALDAAIASPDPGASIEGLAPTTPTYRLLRQALKNVHTGFLVNGQAVAAHSREIEVNLERERWLPRQLPADRVWVNVADQRVLLYRDEQVVFSAKVIVGQVEKRNQSPEFQVPLDAVLFNPPWMVPPYIAKEEILPLVKQDPNYLAKHNMIMMPDGGVQQLASPNSGLGQLMFYMDNKFDVYLHDTPSKNLFLRDDRHISHGCIRVENPKQLAALLMRQPVDAINQEIATGGTNRRPLPKPVPVFVVYETAFAEFDGRLQFRPDPYGRDAEIWQYLKSKGRAMAERAAPDQHAAR
jgi:murein L,D-transpeptidase YcbB/YkuD